MLRRVGVPDPVKTDGVKFWPRKAAIEILEELLADPPKTPEETNRRIKESARAKAPDELVGYTVNLTRYIIEKRNLKKRIENERRKQSIKFQSPHW